MGNSEYNKPSQKDYDLIQTKALPAGASAVYSTAFDLKTAAAKHDPSEIKINAPLLAAGELTATETQKYDVQHSTDNSTFTDIAKEVLVQTGVTGGGAAAQTKRFKLPSDCNRYVRVAATNSAADNSSAKEMTIELLF